MGDPNSVDEIAERSAVTRSEEVSTILRDSKPYTIMCTTLGVLGAAGMSAADVPWYYSVAVVAGGYFLGQVIDGSHYKLK